MNDSAVGAAAEGPIFPYPDPPTAGELCEVAPGILWARIPLPFKLDHLNVYFLEDQGGWAVVDTGTADDRARDAWNMLLAGPLAGASFTKVIATHAHADHIGLAGWLCERLDVPLLTSRSCYLGSANMLLGPEAPHARTYENFHLQHGMSEEAALLAGTRGAAYRQMVSSLPPSFRRLAAGDTLRLGGRAFAVMSADGHAPEQLMLYCALENVFLAADQVLAGINPIVGVSAVEPDDDPLASYLASLSALEANVSDSALVLPGHQLPFVGLHARCRNLAAHHARRCEMIANICRAAPRSIGELLPILYRRRLDARQYCFAFSETHAHVNHLVARGDARWLPEEGLRRVCVA